MKLLLTLLISIGANCFCVAQEQEHLEPSERKFQSLVREPLTLYKGFFRGGVTVLFSTIDQMFDADGNKVPLYGNGSARQWVYQPFLQYGFTDRLQAEISIPYVNAQLAQSVQFEFPVWDSIYTQRWTRKTHGLGDVDLIVSYQFIEGTQTKPGVAVVVTGTLPTGEKNPKSVNKDNPLEYDAAPGYGEYAVQGQVRLRKIMFPFAYNLFVGYKHFFPGEKILQAGDTKERSFKSGDMVSFSGAFNMHLNNWIVFRNLADIYLFQASEADEVKGEKSKLFTYTAGLSFQLKQFRLDQIATVPLLGSNSGADVGYAFIIMYTF
jgi:hypothetical protein